MESSNHDRNWAKEQYAEFLNQLTKCLSYDSDLRPLLFIGAGVSIYLSEGLSPPRGWGMSYGELMTAFQRAYSSRELSCLDFLDRNLPVDQLDYARQRDPLTYQETLFRLFWTNSRDSLDALEKIRHREDGGRWRLIKDLMKSCGCVVTTNYDPLCFAIQRELRNEGEDWQVHNLANHYNLDSNLVQQLTDTNQARPLLVYWHGGIDLYPSGGGNSSENECAYQRLENTVLTLGDFASAYPFSPASTSDTSICRTLAFQRLIQSRPILFLGFSLRDPVLSLLIRQATTKKQKHFRHFLVYIDPGYCQLTHIYESFRNQLNINPIFAEAAISDASAQSSDEGNALDTVLRDIHSLYTHELQRAKIKKLQGDY